MLLSGCLIPALPVCQTQEPGSGFRILPLITGSGQSIQKMKMKDISRFIKKIRICISGPSSLLHDAYPTRECYPFNLEIFNKADLKFSNPVTFFIGENGPGKSTLLKAIARNCTINIWEEDMRTRFHYNRFEDRAAQVHTGRMGRTERFPDRSSHQKFSVISQRSSMNLR